MIVGLDIPHNLLGRLALEAQLRKMDDDHSNANRAMLERHMGLTTIQALRLLLDGVPEEHVWADCIHSELSDTLMRTYLGTTLTDWDQSRPDYLSPLSD